MGLRIPPSSSSISDRSPSISIPSRIYNSNSTNFVHQPRPLPSASTITHYTTSELIRLNSLSDVSCLVVISSKVYDLTLWLDEEDHDEYDPADEARDQVRLTSKTDPLLAGLYLAHQLNQRGINLESQLADCRIGEFDDLQDGDHHPSTDPGGGAEHLRTYVQLRDHSTPPTATTSMVSQPRNRSHLSRALELVEHHKRLVIDAQSQLGVAHLSLSCALAGLADAEKKRDHLIMLASEGFRPRLPEWEDDPDSPTTSRSET